MKDYYLRKLLGLLDKVTEDGTDAAYDTAKALRERAWEDTGTECGITRFQNCAIQGIIDGILYDGTNPDSIETALNYIFS